LKTNPYDIDVFLKQVSQKVLSIYIRINYNDNAYTLMAQDVFIMRAYSTKLSKWCLRSNTWIFKHCYL